MHQNESKQRVTEKRNQQQELPKKEVEKLSSLSVQKPALIVVTGIMAAGKSTIVSIEGNQLSVEFLRVPFDIEGLLEAHFQCDMPHAQWSANLWSQA